MASNLYSLILKILTLYSTIILLFTHSNGVIAVSEREIESMIAALRARGYNLFGNAIVTSDIHYEVLTGTSFTFFAPTDSSIFALDMTSTSSDYIRNLRYHVIPHRLSVSALRNLPCGTSLRTLVPRHGVAVELRRALGSDVITIDGVDIVAPALFYGRNIAVHGLSGILSFRSPIESPSMNVSSDNSLRSPVVDHSSAPSPEANLSDRHGFEPPSIQEVNNPRIVSPVPEPASIDGFSPADSPEIGGSPIEMSPVYGFWPDSSITPELDSKTHPPAPSTLEYENPAASSPSIADRLAILNPMRRALTSLDRYDNSKEGLKEESGVSEELTAIAPPSMKELAPGTTTPVSELSCPLDSATVDCPAREGGVRLSHVIVQQCDLSTFQHYSICGQTHASRHVA